MRFSEYLATLGRPGGARADREARRLRKPRDPMGTGRKRVLSERLVAQAERQVKGALDFSEKAWPDVLSVLAKCTAADMASLKSAKDLVPKKKGGR